MLTRFEEVQIRIQNKTQGFFLLFGACNGLPVTFIIFRRLPLLYSTRDHPCGMASVNYRFCNSWIYSFPHHQLQYPPIWRQCYNQTCTTPITGDYDMFRWTLRALLCNASNDTYNFYCEFDQALRGRGSPVCAVMTRIPGKDSHAKGKGCVRDTNNIKRNKYLQISTIYKTLHSLFFFFFRT